MSPTLQSFKHINRNGVVLVDFNADWSTPCLAQLSILNQLEKKYDKRAYFISVNVDKNRELALAYQITSIPTLTILKNGKEIRRFVGLQTIEDLSRAIEKTLN